MTAVNSITSLPRHNPQTIARWLCASALAVGALGFANSARANDVFWSVGVASPGVQVAVGNAPQVVYPQVVHPHVVYPPVVYPQAVYPQRVIVVPRPPVVPHGHARPVVVWPHPVVYNHGPHDYRGQRHHGRGHGYGHGYGNGHGNGHGNAQGAHSGWQGGGHVGGHGDAGGPVPGAGQRDGNRQRPGYNGGRDGRDGGGGPQR